jgi:hypothetical protein
MSRHQIQVGANIEVIVGWDNPLNTYFCQVYDWQSRTAVQDEYDEPNWKCGQAPDQCTLAIDLIIELQHSPYREQIRAALTNELMTELINDKKVAQPRTPLQENTLRMLREVN